MGGLSLSFRKVNISDENLQDSCEQSMYKTESHVYHQYVLLVDVFKKGLRIHQNINSLFAWLCLNATCPCAPLRGLGHEVGSQPSVGSAAGRVAAPGGREGEKG